MAVFCSFCKLVIEHDDEYLSLVRPNGEFRTVTQFAHPTCYVEQFLAKKELPSKKREQKIGIALRA